MSRGLLAGSQYCRIYGNTEVLSTACGRSAASAWLQRASGRRILAANRSRRLTTPQTVWLSTTGRWRNPFISMIWAASSTGVSGLADWGSGVIHSETLDADRSVPDAAAFSTSRSVSIPARNVPCMTTVEPTFASTMPAAASATDASGLVFATRVVMRSRSTGRDDVPGLPGSVTSPDLIEIDVAVWGGWPAHLLGEHSPQRARPQRHAGPPHPEHLERRLIESSVGTLRGDGIPDFLETVNQLEEPVGKIVHAITFPCGVSVGWPGKPRACGGS